MLQRRRRELGIFRKFATPSARLVGRPSNSHHISVDIDFSRIPSKLRDRTLGIEIEYRLSRWSECALWSTPSVYSGRCRSCLDLDEWDGIDWDRWWSLQWQSEISDLYSLGWAWYAVDNLLWSEVLQTAEEQCPETENWFYLDSVFCIFYILHHSCFIDTNYSHSILYLYSLLFTLYSLLFTAIRWRTLIFHL